MAKGSEKQRRMDIRKAVGNRVIAPPVTSNKRSAARLTAYACFSCRRSFKIAEREERARCPSCSKEIFWMGRTFMVPKRRDREQWRKIQALYAHGFRFFSYRSYPDAPRLPRRFCEVESFVADNPDHPFRIAAQNPDLMP